MRCLPLLSGSRLGKERIYSRGGRVRPHFRVIVFRPRVPRGAKTTKQLTLTANSELRLVGPLKFDLSRGRIHHAKLSC